VCCSKKYFSLLLNSCILSNRFIVFGNLLYNFIPIFAPLFLRSVVLQNLVCRSNFWHVQWLCISPLYFIFSMFVFTQHTISLIYRQGKGSIFRFLNILNGVFNFNGNTYRRYIKLCVAHLKF
jgi:hypothetical protein